MDNQSNDLNEWEEIKDVENALMDSISIFLYNAYGTYWINQTGATSERNAIWSRKKT